VYQNGPDWLRSFAAILDFVKKIKFAITELLTVRLSWNLVHIIILIISVYTTNIQNVTSRVQSPSWIFKKKGVKWWKTFKNLLLWKCLFYWYEISYVASANIALQSYCSQFLISAIIWQLLCTSWKKWFFRKLNFLHFCIQFAWFWIFSDSIYRIQWAAAKECTCQISGSLVCAVRRNRFFHDLGVF